MFFQKITGGSQIDTCYCGVQMDAPIAAHSISFGIAHPGYTVTYVRDSYVLHVVISGTAVHDGQEVGAGDIFFLRPMAAHHFEITGNQPFSQYWIEFSGTDVKSKIEECYFEPNSIHRGIDSSSLHGLLREAVYGDADEKACASRQLGLIHLILSLLPSKEALKTDDGYVRRAMDFLRRNLSMGVTASDAARAVGVSERYLYRLFLAECGMTPIDFLSHCRTDTAKKLLRGTALGVNEIAAAVGITDPSYFSRFFKRCIGCSPSDYRSGQF